MALVQEFGGMWLWELGGLAWETFRDTTVTRLRHENLIYVLKNYDFMLSALLF